MHNFDIPLKDNSLDNDIIKSMFASLFRSSIECVEYGNFDLRETIYRVLTSVCVKTYLMYNYIMSYFQVKLQHY